MGHLVSSALRHHAATGVRGAQVGPGLGHQVLGLPLVPKDLTEVTAVEQVLNDVPALSQLIDGSRFLPRRNGARWIQLDQRPAA